MELYDVVLFGHIVTAICAFAVGGTLHAGEWSARSAGSVEELRGTLRMGHRLEPLFPAFLVLLTGLGAWLVSLSDERHSYEDSWLVLSIVAVVVLFAVGGALLGPRAKRIWEGLQHDGPVTPEVRSLTNDPVVWLFGHLNTSIALTVVFLMTAKPGTTGSVVALVVGPALGLLLGYAGLTRARRPAAS